MPARRRIPALVWAVGGTTAAVVYGVVAAKMTFGPPLVVLGLGGLVLALAGVALARTLDPLVRTDGDRLELPSAPARLRDLEREKQAVLKTIRELELDYQMRKIAESDYREMAERYRTRAMRLIRELDAGDDYRTLIEQELKTRLAALEVAGKAGTRSSGCPACGAGNDADALFCKKCGQKLEARLA